MSTRILPSKERVMAEAEGAWGVLAPGAWKELRHCAQAGGSGGVGVCAIAITAYHFRGEEVIGYRLSVISRQFSVFSFQFKQRAGWQAPGLRSGALVGTRSVFFQLVVERF
jgi:hypothetical protein